MGCKPKPEVPNQWTFEEAGCGFEVGYNILPPEVDLGFWGFGVWGFGGLGVWGLEF